jgi:ATP-dependent Clp protease adaptor protein ClpS
MNPHHPGDQTPDRRPSSAGRPRFFPRYRVLLHRSPDKDLMFIVRTVMELTHYPREEATHRMWEAYQRGQASILVTHLERAELFVELFEGKGLQASVEPIAN